MAKFQGIDWGSGESQTVTFFVDPSTGQTRSAESYYAEILRRQQAAHPARQSADQKRRLIVDYKVGTTTGTEKVGWLRAQRYLRMGRAVTLIVNGKAW